MLDNLYANIGNKIKNWAKWIFIIETISAIIGGFMLLVNEDFLYGFLCLVVGPIVAFVSTWLLYGFGELIEDVGLIRRKLVGEKVDIQPAPKEKKTVVNQQAPTIPPVDVQIKRKYAWDHWDEEDSSVGQCEICGKTKQFLLYVEFEDANGKHQKNLCYDCFSQRDCKSVESRK